MRDSEFLPPERRTITLHVRRKHKRGTGMPWWLTVALVGLGLAVVTVAVMQLGHWGY